jgi:hypothetical protein
MKDGVWYAGKMYGSNALQLAALEELLEVTEVA